MISKKIMRKNTGKKDVKNVDALNFSKKKPEAKKPPELKVKLIPTDIRSL